MPSTKSMRRRTQEEDKEHHQRELNQQRCQLGSTQQLCDKWRTQRRRRLLKHTSQSEVVRERYPETRTHKAPEHHSLKSVPSRWLPWLRPKSNDRQEVLLEPKWLRRWWWWCRRCNNEDVSVHVNACVQRIRKTGWRQCTSPFGWSDQPEKGPCACFPPKAGSRRPQCKPHPTPSRGKRLRGTPTSPLLRRKGGAIFSIVSELDALDRERTLKMLLAVSSWLTGPASQSYLYNPEDYQILPTPLRPPNRGRTQRGKLLVKTVVLQRSFKVPSRSSAADPSG